MPNTIEAAEKNLQDLFSHHYLFEIPIYQRPYAWGIEQTSELLEDLVNAMADEECIADVSPYFLGSMVVVEQPGNVYHVVDGQQRLTTLTILLSVLRGLAEDTSADDLDMFIWQQGNKFAGTEDRFRVTLRENDREFFRNNIQIPGKIKQFLTESNTVFKDSKKLIFENAVHLWEELSNFDQTKRDCLASFLIQCCYLVVVISSDRQLAFRMFSVLNNRGLNLSPTDILKADVIGGIGGNADEDLRSENALKWEKIEEELGRAHFRELFAHIRTIYMKKKAQTTLDQEFQEAVLVHVKDGQDFIDRILIPYKEAYQTVCFAEYLGRESTEEINAYLNHLDRLDNFDWVPPALEFFRIHSNDSNLLLKFIRDLERLAYALYLQRANINERIQRYAEIIGLIERKDDIFDQDSPLQLSNEDKTAVIEVLEGAVFPITRICKILLLRLDSLLADSGVTYNHSVITVEHVLPQNPSTNSQWLDWFSEENVREYWTHRLANLVLLSRRKNSQASNYNFARKKSEYFQRKGCAPFALTSQVLESNEWTAEVLENRQSDLMNKFKEAWRLT